MVLADSLRFQKPTNAKPETVSGKFKRQTMLDFYIIKDNQNLPDYPEQVGLEFVGGLDLKTFTNLQKKRLLTDSLTFTLTSGCPQR